MTLTETVQTDRAMGAHSDRIVPSHTGRRGNFVYATGFASAGSG